MERSISKVSFGNGLYIINLQKRWISHTFLRNNRSHLQASKTLHNRLQSWIVDPESNISSIYWDHDLVELGQS